MPTLIQWVHVASAVIGVGGIAFLLFILLPSARLLSPDQRDSLVRTLMARFRWVTWSVIVLLLGTGLYNVRMVWEVPWGKYWKLLTIKIVLAAVVFLISLCLTLPFKFCDRFRSRRQSWLAIAFALAMLVILISAYLRRA